MPLSPWIRIYDLEPEQEFQPGLRPAPSPPVLVAIPSVPEPLPVPNPGLEPGKPKAKLPWRCNTSSRGGEGSVPWPFIPIYFCSSSSKGTGNSGAFGVLGVQRVPRFLLQLPGFPAAFQAAQSRPLLILNLWCFGPGVNFQTLAVSFVSPLLVHLEFFRGFFPCRTVN